MADLHGCRLGFVVCGSFCSSRKTLAAAEACVRAGAELLPVVSPNFATTRTRFGSPAAFLEALSALGGGQLVQTLTDAEPIGPKHMTDALVVCPCTGNMLGKLAAGITDNCACLAVKSHLRGGRPVVLCVATNDGLAASARNIGELLNRKHYYFVPFGQDDAVHKPTSLVADFGQVPAAVEAALRGEQLQPLLLAPGREG